MVRSAATPGVSNHEAPIAGPRPSRRSLSRAPQGEGREGAELVTLSLGRTGPSIGRSCRFHYSFMTCRAPAAASASWSLPAKGFSPPVEYRVPTMAPAPNPGPSTAVATTGLGSFGIVRRLAVAAPHLAALVLML